MSIIAALLVLFITVPLAELAMLLWLSSVTSIWFTMGTVIVTGLIGTLLARSQGYATWQKIRTQLASAQMPADSMVDAAMIFAAGALLMTPGILTDGLGFSLLIPNCRTWMKRIGLQWIKRNFQVQTFTSTSTSQSHPEKTVIESHVVSDPSGERE